ncbi:hypothetical protein Bca4012_025098 [Brassica carinata]
MSNNDDDDSQKPPETSTSGGVVSRSARTLSDYLRTISSGASTVARTAASAASSVVNRDTDSLRDKVLWAGFDKLEKEDGDTRRVLLLAFHSGFQIWDVEDTENVHVIVSAHDGHAAFMQMLPYPLVSQDTDDVFSESRPLLAVCGDSSWVEILDRETDSDDAESETVVPTHVNVYSLKSNYYVHTLKFQSVIYTIRCSSRIVAVLQADQIDCFDAKTLVEEYSIVTNSIAYGSLGVGYGPLAVGPRWIAYTASRIAESSSTVFTSELLPLSSSPSVAEFARESSKHIVSGIVRLGGKGYKSLSQICTDALPNPYNPGLKGIGVAADKEQNTESIGMVVISDVINKSLICQFKAHKNPVSALSFDPSGMLLVTASTQGHNTNVFKILPRTSNTSDPSKESFMHLFSLRRGYTYAVIQGISFSNDSSVIVVSSSRGTSHLFEIDPEREEHLPVSLSAVIKIRSRDIGGWIGTMSGAAAAAAGMVVRGGGGSLPGSTTTTFSGSDNNSLTRNLLVFAPSGCMTQYALKAGEGDEALVMTGIDDSESSSETEGPVVTVRRWSMIQNRARREMQAQHSAEEPWKVTKKGKARRVEDNHQRYVSETELRMYPPSQLALWEWENCRFQKLVLDVDEESTGGGRGEMEIERIQTQTIEARTRDNVLAASVVAKSLVQNSLRPHKIVLHIITDRKTYFPMQAWFSLHPLSPAIIEVKALHHFDWLSKGKVPVLEAMEKDQRVRSQFRGGSSVIVANNSENPVVVAAKLQALSPKYNSKINHIRIHLPELFPSLDKVVFLDDDIVIQTDLSQLWDIDMDGKVNGAVETCRGEDKFVMSKKFKSYLNFSNPIIARNFNPEECAWAYGMNVFDLAAWRKTNISSTYYHWLDENLKSDLSLWQLGTLPPGLIAFHGHVLTIDPFWHILGLGY